MAILGALTFTSVFFIVKHLIFSIKDDQEFVEWAWDMFTLYYSISLPVFLVLILVLLLSVLLSIFQDPKRGSSSPVIRVMAATASSVLMLLIAPCYGFMTDNQIISIYPYILVSGLAEALIFRIVFVLEYFIRSKTNVKNR
ncbi:MAG: hypothetical protein E7672_04245 [Ruminococcaceae bacterium]|nr:hypothetical protein [Oscillospiraceae bacterium]